MANTGHVHWHEGLFLQPHHLQWMQQQFLEQIRAERRLAWEYPYGVVEARLSTDALENMLVQFDKLRVVMPSGVELNVPETTDLPPKDVKQAFMDGGSFVVSLGVPLWYPTRANTLDGQRNEDWRVKRLFKVAEIDRPDENTGENAQPMQVRRINARLMLEGEDATDLEVIPLLRISHTAGKEGGLPRQDPAFIPPCMTLQGSPTLRELCRDLANQVEARRRELVTKIPRTGFSIEALRGIQFVDLMKLRSLNRFTARLPALVAAPATSPFRMYLELRELIGELAALKPAEDPFAIPAYDHDNPSIAFKEIAERLRSLLPPETTQTVLKVDFARHDRVMLAALTDEHLARPNEYFLAIQTKQDPGAVAKLVEDHDLFKFMAKSLVKAAIWGVTLTEERNPPLQLPKPTGLNYFRVNRSDNASSTRMWEMIRREKAVALRWPDIDNSDFGISLYMTVPEAQR